MGKNNNAWGMHGLIGQGVQPNRNSLSFGFGEMPQIHRDLGVQAASDQIRTIIPGLHFSLIVDHAPQATIRRISDHNDQFSGFIWGICFALADGSPDAADEILLAAAASGNSRALNQLGGLFMAVVLDRYEDKLHLFTDYLGARPFFITEQKGALFGASHALTLVPFMGRPARADLDAVSQYFVFGYNATNKSLVAGINRLDASLHVTWSRGRKIQQNYGAIEVVDRPIGYRAMAERIYHIVSRSYRNWTRDRKALTFGLSGGYDSRFLCALSLTGGPQQKRYINIENMLSEKVMARDVARRLDIPLEVIRMGNSDWDAYAPEGIFHCRPDGFPVTKSVSRLVFRQALSSPMVDGYLGDALIRGHMDMILGHLEGPEDSKTASSIIAVHQANGPTLSIFKPGRRQTIKERAYASAQDMVVNHKTSGHLITAFDLFMRQRSYISNNYIQNLDEMEPCLPFYDPELIALKRAYPYADFGLQTYDEIFSRYVPQLAGLGHNNDLNVIEPVSRTSHVQRQWMKKAWPQYLFGKGRGIIDKSFILPRLASAVTMGKGAYVMMPMMFLDTLRFVCSANDIFLE